MVRRFPILAGTRSNFIGCILAMPLMLVGVMLMGAIGSVDSVVLAIFLIVLLVGLAYGIAKLVEGPNDSYALVDEEGVFIQTPEASLRILHKEIATVSHHLPDAESNYHVEITLYSGKIIKLMTHLVHVSDSGDIVEPVSLKLDQVGAALTSTILEFRSKYLQPPKGKALRPSNRKAKSKGIATKKARERSVKDALVKALREVDRLRKKRGGFSSQTAAREFRLPNAAIARLRAERVVVGLDGVLFAHRFIPHADIAAVYHQTGGRRGYVFFGAMLKWVVSLRLKNGEVLDLGSHWVREGSEDKWGAELAQAIHAAHEAWSVAQGGTRSEEELLARGKRTGAEWLQWLRDLRRGNVTAYRTGLVHNQGLLKLLDDAGAKPSTRAAAAVALAASGDKTTTPRLRVAAESMADPRIHVLLEKVADASDEEAVIEALAALEEAERLKRR